MASHCIGVPVPRELRAEIAEFCRARRYTPTGLYIELFSPRQLEGTADLAQRLEMFSGTQQPIQAVVAGPNCRGNELLYLTVLPGAINILRDRMAKHLGLGAGTIYRPLLPVMRKYPGFFLDLDRYLAEARHHFVRPFPIDIAEVVLYRQDSPRYPFKPATTIPFSG